MQTQDSQLREIQAGNEEVRKKLQVFSSGLQKLMSKKSSKKSQKHEPPSHDTKKSFGKQQSQYQYKNNSPIQQSPQQGNKLQQSQFGFNSTLFRQLNDQTVLSNNSSGVNEFYKQQNGQYDNNYESVGSLNSQKGGQYYSTSTKKSQQVYNYQSFTPTTIITGINNNNNGDKSPYSLKQPQSFKKSSLLFSEIDQLMNRVNKSSKLPVKPIQKYINQQQNKLISENNQIELSLSNSSLILTSDQNRGKPQFQQLRKKQKPFQDNNTKRSFKKEQNKTDKVSVRQSLKQTGDFLKNMKQRSSSIQSMKQPPLPPPQSLVKPLNNKPRQKTINRDKGEDFLEWGRKISQKMGKSRGQQQNEQQQQRRQQITHQKQQIKGEDKIANKVKSTINERKKLMKQDHLMDDSIVLQLSSQQQQQQQNNKHIDNQQGGQNRNKVTLIEIHRLEQQKQLLLNELKQIQSQLQQLESQL